MNHKRTDISASDIDGPTIYVADLAAYNDGHHHGVWIDATEEVYDMQEIIDEMLVKSPSEGAEEIAIHAYEGFGGIEIGSNEDLESVNHKALFVQEHGELGALVLAKNNSDIEVAEKILEDDHFKEVTSLKQHAKDYVDDLGVPSFVAARIDFDDLGEALLLELGLYEIEVSSNEIHLYFDR